MNERGIDSGKPQPDIIIDLEKATPEVRERLEKRADEMMTIDSKLSRGEAIRRAGQEVIDDQMGEQEK
ncbi:MAG: hypothetical protein US94_C0035G0008 [Berkelbacteria bacterium GW2011_GWB1_38_5]|uniref:Uncharacterized protein n=2 Tax=Candidatus Berkelbacteria TaxID=1618330 RepID=A0A0G0LS40_9BACT|nr:MAG: hypothetical protein US94_C0035G0008 [Berkelbacteria bacterium GW2011_GWB1_38_5]KKQ90785.1 MAG: hypothetical protein UT15_C0004G0008 [Berkelbacteria bacterium GW2011_GWA1_39_10]